jgi:hypothetical protein
MVNVKEIIKDTEVFCKNRLSYTPNCLSDAIKIMKMWQHIKVDGIKRYYGSGLSLDELVEEIEEKFSPSIITQTVTIEIQGKSEQRLRNTISTIECVDGVKDVRPHDSRY